MQFIEEQWLRWDDKSISHTFLPPTKPSRSLLPSLLRSLTLTLTHAYAHAHAFAFAFGSSLCSCFTDSLSQSCRPCALRTNSGRFGCKRVWTRKRPVWAGKCASAIREWMHVYARACDAKRIGSRKKKTEKAWNYVAVWFSFAPSSWKTYKNKQNFCFIRLK